MGGGVGGWGGAGGEAVAAWRGAEGVDLGEGFGDAEGGEVNRLLGVVGVLAWLAEGVHGDVTGVDDADDALEEARVFAVIKQ